MFHVEHAGPMPGHVLNLLPVNFHEDHGLGAPGPSGTWAFERQLEP